jgi:hypothetical protein
MHIGNLKTLKQRERDVAVAEAPRLRHVTWYKDPGLRKLYAMAVALFFASATTGYDGYDFTRRGSMRIYVNDFLSSMLNGLQILPVWQNYFNHPSGSLLGLFGCIYSVGSLASLPFA